MKTYLRKVAVVSVVLACCLVAPASARISPIWISVPEEITHRSELIVIARPLSTATIGPATNMIYAGFKDDDMDLSRMKAFFVPVNTTFEITTVLKGSIGTNRLVFFHYAWDRNHRGTELDLSDAPSLVCFTNHVTYPMGCLLADFKYPRYLLFLSKMPDGPFRATTGQIDPEESVHLLVSEDRFDLLAEDYMKARRFDLSAEDYVKAIGKKRQPTSAGDVATNDVLLLRQHSELKANGKTIQTSSDKAISAAARLFSKVSFLFKTREEVLDILGNPATISDYGVKVMHGKDPPMFYRFDTGFGGGEYKLTFSEEIVVGIEFKRLSGPASRSPEDNK